MSKAHLVCNLWHIKQTNGLFYYALDYVRAIDKSIVVLVRPALLEAASNALPQHQVRAVSLVGIVGLLLHSFILRRWVFTPTSHPFPLHNRQLIVVHDDYPFLGRQGRIKRLLFQFALWTSRCHVGHINHSTALQYSSVSSQRLWFMPNPGPDEHAVQQLQTARAQIGSRKLNHVVSVLRVALFGSDSRKKRYEMLFLHCEQAGGNQQLSFLIYGHPTDYYHELCMRFPELDIQLISSSDVSMESFLANIDAVASVAEHEGFGRPIALALAAGVPCYLLNSPVFSEFFGRSTKLHESAVQLVQELLVWQQGAMMKRQFEELPQIRASFQIAAGRLAALAHHGRLFK